MSHGEAVAVALIENIQREQLTPAEEARALKRLIEEFALTHGAVGQAAGRSRAAVSNLLRLLDLPEEVLQLIDAKRLSMGHARALLGIEDATDQRRLGQAVADRGLSVRETEHLVRRTLKGSGAGVGPGRPAFAAVREVIAAPGVRVALQPLAAGAAKIIIEVDGERERDAVLAAIRASDLFAKS